MKSSSIKCSFLRLSGHAVLLASLGTALPSCDGDVRAPRLDSAAHVEVTTENDDEWLRSQQLLRVKVETFDTQDHEKIISTVYEDKTVADALNYVGQSCYGWTGNGGSCVVPNTCEAKTLLAISTAQSDPVVVQGVDGAGIIQQFTFEKITDANAAEFAAYAVDKAQSVVASGLESLKNRPYACRAADPDTGAWKTSNGRSVAHDFASAVVEAYYIARQAYDRAFEATMAVADSAHGSSVSAIIGEKRAEALPLFSRAGAAHLLVGGDDGLLGSTSSGYCATSLTPSQRSALAVLRDAAPNPPALLDDTVAIQALLQTGTPTGGTIRQRLAALNQIKDFGWNAATGTVSLTPTKTVEAYYDLTESDFLAARKYLQEEFSVFGRSTSALHNAVRGVQRYAGLASDRVAELPTAAWTARARYAGGNSPWYDTSLGNWRLAPNGYTPQTVVNRRTPPLDIFIAETVSRIRTLTQTTTNTFSGVPTNAGDQKEVLGVLNSIELGKEYLGAVELLVPSDRTRIRTIAHGFPLADKVRVVVGEDGLRCAVDGNIEGVDCTDTVAGIEKWGTVDSACTAKPWSFACLTLSMPITPSANGAATYFGTTGYLDGTRTGLTTTQVNGLITNKTRLYFVRLKDQSLPQEPGNYESLGGVPISDSSPWNQAFPVTTTVNRKVADALAPNRKDCVENEVSCLGLSLDARLPLEDELTDDGNAFENSWRHYLDLARQAADESALLGREFRDAKINQLQGAAAAEQRKEEQRQAAANSLQEVQNLCGTALDPIKLLDYLSKSGTGAVGERNRLSSVVVAGSCPGNRCVVDPTKLSAADLAGTALDLGELKRLFDCIDDSSASIEPYVTLGDRSFCVWTRGNEVCPTGFPCFKAPPCSTSANATTSIAKPLNYFVGTLPPSERVAGLACSTLRELRGTPDSAKLQALSAMGILNQDRLKDHLGQIGFRAEYGGFFSILEDKNARLSSGNPVTGRSSGWPWSGKATGCANGGAGLFCTELGVPNDTTLAGINGRAFRAAAAAAALLEENLYVVAPTDLKSGAGPCNGTHETAYHTWDATLVTASASTPTWTCKLDDEFSAIDPRTTQATMGWVEPSGTRRSGVMYFRTSESKVQDTDMKKSLWASWGGLSNQSMFTVAGAGGTVWEALRTNATTPTKLLFTMAGNEHNLLSTGKAFAGGDKHTPLDVTAVLDGLELLCELDTTRQAVAAPGTLDLSSVEAAGEAIRGLADRLNDQAANMLFANVPKLAADALGTAGPTGAFPALSGEMGESVAQLRQGFIATQHAVPAISDALRSLSVELQTLRTQLEINDASKDLIDYDLLSTVLDRATTCAEQTGKPTKWLSGPAAALIACLNSAAQITIAFKKSALQQEIIEGEDQKARLAFIDRMSTNATALEDASLRLAESQEGVSAALARIDGLKKRAKLAVAKALYLSSYQSEAQANYDKAIGALETLSKKRFDQALLNAKLMSFYAKRAIEQRLGLRLRDLRQAFPLVDAPALWESDICTYGGFQDVDNEDGTEDWVARYGEGFIGDYVNNLQNFVESYRLSENFHEGKDTAIVSLRDDVANVRAECEQPSRNLFASAAQMDARAWRPLGCDPVTVSGSPVLGLNCMSATPRDELGKPDLAVSVIAGYQDSARGYRIQFGDGKDTCAAESGGCGWKLGAMLGQVLHLIPGKYRLSWYTRDTAAAYTNAATTDFAIVRVAGQAALAGTLSTPPNPSATTWKRFAKEFTVSTENDYEVGFGVPTGSKPLSTQPVTVGAPMLEALVPNRTIPLRTFEATDSQGKATIPVCEDSDGALFRLKRWTRQCIRLCNDGFSASCEDGPEHCYREFNFGISQAALQAGRLLNYSGFARGNFNYRIDSLAVNFVGANIRDCEDANLPSTCYNAGFIPYSLHHDGPFFVRNRAGEDVRALLFDGRIEHARGLALGRYFTSPISSTDRDLIADYVRTEFSGRPLDGGFTLRVWDDQALDFKSIEDVQLILNYRYWTAFD